MPPDPLISISLPRSMIEHLTTLPCGLTKKLHALLERNADDRLSADEKRELETLVHLSQFSQILALTANGSNTA